MTFLAHKIETERLVCNDMALRRANAGDNALWVAPQLEVVVVLMLS